LVKKLSLSDLKIIERYTKKYVENLFLLYHATNTRYLDALAATRGCVILVPAAVAFFIILVLAACAVSLPVYMAIVMNAVNVIVAIIMNNICLNIKMLTTKKHIWVLSNLFLNDGTDIPFSIRTISSLE
jgi:hypothetical protein